MSGNIVRLCEVHSGRTQDGKERRERDRDRDRDIDRDEENEEMTKKEERAETSSAGLLLFPKMFMLR